jgi:hypothetical protein
MFSTLLMGGGGHAREKDHQNVKSLIIFARDCSSWPSRFRLVILGGIDKVCRLTGIKLYYLETGERREARRPSKIRELSWFVPRVGSGLQFYFDNFSCEYFTVKIVLKNHFEGKLQVLSPYVMLGKCDMQILRSQHWKVWCIVRDFGLGIF